MLIGCGVGPNLSPASQGAISGTITSKLVAEAIKKLPKFMPYVKVEDFEVCEKKSLMHYECILIISGEKRYLGATAVEKDSTLVVLTESSFIRFIANLEVYCLRNETICKEVAESYDSIESIYIVGENNEDN